MSDLRGSVDVEGLLGRSAERPVCGFTLKKRPLAKYQRDKLILQGDSTVWFPNAASFQPHPKQSLEPPIPNHQAMLRIPAWTCIFWYNVVR